jgi:hypothetical protein
MKRLVCALLIVALLVALPVTSQAQNGWTWRGNIFPSSFSPSSYQSGYWNYGNYQYFGGNMQWNSTRASNIRRIYAPQGFRYTHDITDLNNNLGYVGWQMTNFPDPKFDSDNDQWWDPYIFEETEVTARDPNFPQDWTWYYFLVEMKRGGYAPYRVTNGGTVNHTPAISAKFWWSAEWQTMDYERRPYQQGYPSITNGRQTLVELLENYQMGKTAQIKKQSSTEFVELELPLSIEEFTEKAKSLDKELKSFTLQYEVQTEFGQDIVTIRGLPDESEVIPLEHAQRMLSLLPSPHRTIRFRGIVGYEVEKTKTE